MHTLCHGFKHVRLKLQILTILSESVIMIVKRAYEAHMCNDLSIYSRDNQSLFIAKVRDMYRSTVSETVINFWRLSNYSYTFLWEKEKCSNPGYITQYIFISPCAFRKSSSAEILHLHDKIWAKGHKTLNTISLYMQNFCHGFLLKRNMWRE